MSARTIRRHMTRAQRRAPRASDPTAVLALMEQLARRRSAEEEAARAHAEEEHCPLCQMIAAHGDPSTRQEMVLPDGSTVEIIELLPPLPDQEAA